MGPIPDSYWLLDGLLLAGEYPATPARDGTREKLTKFLEAGIRTFVDLTEAEEPLLKYDELLREIATERGIETRYCRRPVRDLGIPEDRGQMASILATIREEIDAGRPVYVHCWGGIGRTGTVIGCWLVEQGFTGPDAIERIAELRARTPDGWKQSPETEEQCRYVCEWGMGQGRRNHRAQVTRDFPIRSDGGDGRMNVDRTARYHGALLGLAAGDALGTTLEFTTKGHVEPIDDMIGGGPFSLPPGHWTDDTSMALCLAESLAERESFDPHDQMTRYVRWWREGHWSSTGTCFDIGNATRAALSRYEADGDPFAGSMDPHSAGNGSLMRLAPIALRYADDPAQAVHYAAESSRTTHGAREAIDACRYFAALLVGALTGYDKSELLSQHFAPEGLDWSAQPLAPSIDAIAAGSFRQKSEDEIRASGYVVHTLEAALWAFSRTSTFRDGALLTVNLGEDADTTGAVYGQLAGAYYGGHAIPETWRNKIVKRGDIERLASALLERAVADAP